MHPDLLSEPEACVGQGAESKALCWGRLGANEGEVAQGGVVAIFESTFMVRTYGIDNEVVSESSGYGLDTPDVLGPWVENEGDKSHR